MWYKATAGNAYFHAYIFPQRIGVTPDWYRVLNAQAAGDRFQAWGIINDPSCCTPGDAGCPAQNLDETYGFQWCPGDDELLKFVGKDGYRDPACDFKEVAASGETAAGAVAQRQAACDLAFGTSTGALGLRKFPNPRFSAARWKQLNGSPASWEGYRKPLSDNPADSADYRISRLRDGSVEPPFLIGMSCGACHIGFDPLNPPADTAHPQWDNIKLGVGNQYLRMSEILASGMPTNSLEWQVFAHARPGTTDTSAVPTDQVNNPGTINALVNLAQRPLFTDEDVTKWRRQAACPAGEDEKTCWCEPGRDGKCWKKSAMTGEKIHHILKGGEDSIGFAEALQRVYINIGSCAAQCWANHLTDLRQIDPQARNYGQTPVDIGQCRRDCANFRAIEDRIGNVQDFLLSGDNYATDLYQARARRLQQADPKARYGYENLVADLEKEFGPGAVERGRLLFAENCARCHSSIPEATGGPFANRSFREEAAPGLRADFLGNDVATPVSEVGTFRCRALHSNHMAGHVWQEFGSESLRARPPDANLKEPADGGRGYYRNISLLSLWAHAPFMHNNALGPELCGKPADAKNDFRRDRYVDADGQLLPAQNQPACWPYDPSVEGRYKLYVESMRELLNPKTRVPKITKFNEPIRIDVGPRLWDGAEEKRVLGFTLVIPAGTNAGALGNFQHKQFMQDLIEAKLRPMSVTTRLAPRLGMDEAKRATEVLAGLTDAVLADPSVLVDAAKKQPELLRMYSSCLAEVENDGHRFGESLPEADKNALIAFLATL
ncbi:MAG: cytochrome c [Rhodocyclaceae bacterium]|nr:cytochrome c [Rhodocyclaceae bacterium]MBX3667296.1 cytochrome c [Rhodocyclaceae bacterium]